MADGFSMAVANYLSTKSESELIRTKRLPKALDLVFKHPLKAAFATYISFIVLGFIPLLPFITSAVLNIEFEHIFLYSTIFAALALFSVGAVKGFVVRKHPFKSALETLVIGGIAASMAYIVGAWIQNLLQ